ncbi:polyphosphate kinase 2 family [Elysia marginata]|uniref:Polyphosphate kinase 2 family n=1 Tax=Elysia marginata TaxID=1093978 RepID=A0AAV4HK82_9GAST|nr:polyphosphate kinase 2 family [Elysia marginata]
MLRRDIEIPANKSIEAYFVCKGGKFLGRLITTLPNVLNKDLSRLATGELRLKTNEDLDHLRSIAQDRQQSKGLTTKIREAAAAEASRSRTRTRKAIDEDTTFTILLQDEDTTVTILLQDEDTTFTILLQDKDTTVTILLQDEDTTVTIMWQDEDTTVTILLL